MTIEMVNPRNTAWMTESYAARVAGNPKHQVMAATSSHP